MLDFTLPTIEYVETIHQRDIEKAEKHRQIQSCQRIYRPNLLNRFIHFVLYQNDNPDISAPEQSSGLKTNLKRATSTE